MTYAVQAKHFPHGYTARLAEFIDGARYDSLGETTSLAAKRLILDTLGNAVGGSLTSAAATAIKTRLWLGGERQSTILVDGGKTSVTNAVFANVVQASALEYDDTCLNLGHHAQNSLMPALALAELQGASGRDLLLAFTLAYDIGARVASSARHIKLSDSGEIVVNPSGGGVNWVVFPAVVGAARILGLPRQALVSALGVAGFSATVPTGARWISPPRNDLKYNPYAVMAESGTLAALLASRGFTGDPCIFDGDPELGLADWWLMSGTVDSHPEDAIADLGERWFVEEAAIKPYPSCRFTHGALALFEQIMRDNRLGAADIEQVRVSAIGQMFVYHMDDPLVGSASDCQFSMPHCVAMSALGIPAGPRWVAETYWRNPEVESLKQKVVCLPNEEADRQVMSQLLGGQWEKTPVRLEVDARGQTFSASSDYAPGDPAGGMALSDEAVFDKFRQNCVDVLPGDNIERCIEAVMSLEQQETVQAVVDCLSR